MIKINEYNELKMFVETTSIEADSLDDFILFKQEDSFLLGGG